MVVSLAASGQVVLDVFRESFYTSRGWELRSWTCECLRVNEIFSWKMVAHTSLIDDSGLLSQYAVVTASCTFLAVRHEVTLPSPEETVRLLHAIHHRDGRVCVCTGTITLSSPPSRCVADQPFGPGHSS